MTGCQERNGQVISDKETWHSEKDLSGVLIFESREGVNMESVIKSAAMLDGSRPHVGPTLMNLS